MTPEKRSALRTAKDSRPNLFHLSRMAAVVALPNSIGAFAPGANVGRCTVQEGDN